MVLVTEPFERVARSSAEARGAAKLPIVVLPADLEDRSPDDIAEVVGRFLDEIRDALLRPGR